MGLPHSKFQKFQINLKAPCVCIRKVCEICGVLIGLEVHEVDGVLIGLDHDRDVRSWTPLYMQPTGLYKRVERKYTKK